MYQGRNLVTQDQEGEFEKRGLWQWRDWVGVLATCLLIRKTQ